MRKKQRTGSIWILSIAALEIAIAYGLVKVLSLAHGESIMFYASFLAQFCGGALVPHCPGYQRPCEA